MNAYLSRFKPDLASINSRIVEHKIERLFHFTDKANLESIINLGGLFSWAYLEANNVNIPRPGGNKKSRFLDLRRKLQDYVRLSFNPTPPMYHVLIREKVLLDPVIIEVDTMPLLWRDTLFSNINATDNSAKIGPSVADFDVIDFRYAKRTEFVEDALQRKLVQAEALVKTHVPMRYLHIED